MGKYQASLQMAMKTTLPKKEIIKRKKWMTDDILHKMEKRKRYKNNDKEQYDKIDKEIQIDLQKG